MRENLSRYAEAFVAIAVEAQNVPELERQAEFLLDTLAGNAEYLEILNSVKLRRHTKQAMVVEAFGSTVDRNYCNLMCLLVERRLIKRLPTILRDIIARFYELENIKTGTVYSVQPFSAEELRDLEVRVTSKLHVKVVLENVVDPTIIQGIKVIIGDTIFDDSVAGRFTQLKKALLGKDFKGEY